MRGARLLLLMGRKRRYNTSTFANWQPVVGAAADGVASALGDWGLNLVVNGEFSADTAGWGTTATRATISRESAAALGLPASGGADDGILKVLRNSADGALTDSWARQVITAVLSGTYKQLCLAYAPSANAAERAASLYSSVPVTAEDEWQALSRPVTAISTSLTFYLQCLSTTVGDIAYFDKAEIYRQNTPLLSPHRAASGVWTWAIAQPASGVVPWSALVRYADSLNYWEVRTAPNTDGNDLELIEVVAGVETVRAAADVDWTADETDALRITARGTTIGVEHRKHGETVWTAGLSYASATAHQTASQYGQMQWGTGEKRAASVRWDK